MSTRAQDRKDILAAINTWKRRLAKGTAENPNAITALYAEDAVLWGTMSGNLRTTPEEIRDYFVNAYTTFPGLKVAFEEKQVQIFGDTAIVSGTYSFTYEQDSETREFPARYTFALHKREGKWNFVHHHSSIMPK